MKKTLMIITLSYLVGQDYTLPSNKSLYFLNDTSRIEQLGNDANIVKKELRKLVNNLREEITISYFTIEIKEAVTERVITSSTMSNKNKDYLFQLTLENPNMTQAEYQYMKNELSQNTYATRETSPREEIKKNKTIVQNKIVATKDAEWSNVINYYGGYAEATKAGISKNDLNKFRIEAKLKNIELISPTECYANIKLQGDKNYAFKYHNISKSDYKYRGTYQIDDVDAIDIYNMTMPEIVFSFDKKEYLNKTQFIVPLKKVLDKPVDIQIYRKTIIQLFDDFISDTKYILLDEIMEIWRNGQERRQKELAVKSLREEAKKFILEDRRREGDRGPGNDFHYWLSGTRWIKPGYFDNLPSERVEAEIAAMKNYHREKEEGGKRVTLQLCGGGVLIVLAIISII